jgi:hypothetical protein
MHRIRVLFPWAMGFVLGALLLAAASRDAGFARRETSRLHAHFARVLHQLHARDVSAWSEARQVGRRHLLALLADYDRAGRFPRNEGQLARRTPIFVDRHDTRCAMAHLIENSGGAAIVARVAATRNLEYIPTLASDTELQLWLAGSGLTLDEAALIQPEYEPVLPGPKPREDETPADDVMTSSILLSLGFAVPAIYMNLRTDRSQAEQRQVRVFGVLAATPALAVGLVDLLHDGHLRGSGLTQLAIGATSITLALLNRAGPPRVPSGQVPAPAPRTAPIFRAGSDGEPQVGVAFVF